jgi:hypothetical protein
MDESQLAERASKFCSIAKKALKNSRQDGIADILGVPRLVLTRFAGSDFARDDSAVYFCDSLQS